jgi:hypothetical protein
MQRMNGGLYRVVASIAGAEVHLLVDTGAAQTHLDRERCKRLDLKWHRAVFVSELGRLYLYSGTRYVLGADPDLRIAGVRAVHGPIYHDDLADLNKNLALRGDKPVDGLLGADVLNNHKCVLDLRNSRLYLLPEGQAGAAPATPDSKGARSAGQP